MRVSQRKKGPCSRGGRKTLRTTARRGLLTAEKRALMGPVTYVVGHRAPAHGLLRFEGIGLVSSHQNWAGEGGADLLFGLHRRQKSRRAADRARERTSRLSALSRGATDVVGRGKPRPWFSRPGGGVILDGHPAPPREKGLSLPAMCRGQTQVEAGSGARVPLRSFSGEGGTTPRGAWGEGASLC